MAQRPGPPRRRPRPPGRSDATGRLLAKFGQPPADPGLPREVMKGWADVWDSTPIDPQMHHTAIAIARRCVDIVQECLREDEVIEATAEFYHVIREELERWKGSKIG